MGAKLSRIKNKDDRELIFSNDTYVIINADGSIENNNHDNECTYQTRFPCLCC